MLLHGYQVSVGGEVLGIHSGDWLHNTVNVLDVTESHNYRWLSDKYYVYVYFTKISKNKRKS